MSVTKERSNQLSGDETRILDMLLAGNHDLLTRLRDQVDRCQVTAREFTGAGFLVHFDLPRRVAQAKRRSAFTISDVGGWVSGHEVGFILFVRDGVIDFLECHVWGDGEISEPWQLEDIYYLRRAPAGSSGALVRVVSRDESALDLQE
jgi:hypothetical protein